MLVATWVLLDEWTQRREAKEACSALEQDEWTQRREAKEACNALEQDELGKFVACNALEQDEPGKLAASVVWVTQPFLKELNWES